MDHIPIGVIVGVAIAVAVVSAMLLWAIRNEFPCYNKTRSMV